MIHNSAREISNKKPIQLNSIELTMMTFKAEKKRLMCLFLVITVLNQYVGKQDKITPAHREFLLHKSLFSKLTHPYF